MQNLIKADLYRIVKGKLSLIVLIIAAAFPLLTSLLYFALSEVLASTGETIDLGIVGFSGKDLLASSYSLTNNLGLIIPIFSAIFITLDISNGTLRNKIVTGASKTNIFFSHFITSSIFNLVIINVYTLFSLAFNCLFLGYGTEFNAKELQFVLAIIGQGSLLFIFVASISTMLTLNCRNGAQAIIFTVLICIGIGLISSLLSFIDVKEYGTILGLFPMYGYNYYSSMYLIDNNLSIVIEGIVSLVAFSALFLLIGSSSFKRKDIK